MSLRSPTVLTAIGVAATLVLALVVVMALLRTGGAKAVSDNAALIGALVALGGVFTTQMVNSALEDRRAQEARKIETQRAQDAALQAYVYQINNLVSVRREGTTPPDGPEFKLAQAQTYTVFMSVDRTRTRIPLRLIYDLGLISKAEPLLSLRGATLDAADLHELTLLDANLKEADLRLANLTGANLKGSDFSGADLRGADLRLAVLTDTWLKNANLLPYDRRNPSQLSVPHLLNGSDPSDVLKGSHLTPAKFNDRYLIFTSLGGANLVYANLSGAFLCRANLEGTTLTRADLRDADLRETVLANSDLWEADLRGANLEGAQGVTDQQLAAAKSLEGATMPNGQKYEDWLKSKGREEDGENSSPS